MRYFIKIAFGEVKRVFIKMVAGPVVSVKQGKLRGRTELVDGEHYYTFKGIPYAEPPIRELRFKASLPGRGWAGVRQAAAHGPACPQYDITTMQTTEGSEDCLYLNVYTKKLKSRSPVVVFTHGGGFMSGSGDEAQYGARYLLQHDVVLVTYNYRLEVLGFLALDTPEVPGNAGLKDQVLALKWVKDNISQFGGDPNNVTIFGESAGSASVTYHMVAPSSEGLFHRAIAQSGTCLNDWALASEPKERAFRIAKALGKDINDTDELLKYLQSVPASKLVKMTFKTATDDEKRRGLAMHFVPNIEKEFPNVEGFITKDPIDLLLEKRVNKVPLIIGYNSAEGLFTMQAILRRAKFLNENPCYLVPRNIARKLSQSKMEEFGKRIIKFYTNDQGFNDDNVDDLVNMTTDVYFGYQTHRFAYFYSLCDVPVYMYRFEYDTELNMIKHLLGLSDMKGACHADDLFYLFSSILSEDVYDEHKDKLKPIVYGLTQLWTNFAKTGNPSSNSSSFPPWHPWTSSGGEYLALSPAPTMRQHGDRARAAFWNRLHQEAGLPSLARSSL